MWQTLDQGNSNTNEPHQRGPHDLREPYIPHHRLGWIVGRMISLRDIEECDWIGVPRGDSRFRAKKFVLLQRMAIAAEFMIIHALVGE